MDIGKKIQKVRESKNLSRNQLSKKVSISESSLFKIETGGIASPSFASVYELANGLGLSLDDLLKA